jgi:hypothetical protein
MSLIVGLPEAVSWSVLTVWLGMVEVCKLDSAFCVEAARSSFMALAYSEDAPACDYSAKEDAEFNKRYYRRESFNRWLLKRRVGISGFAISRGIEVEHDERREWLRRHGMKVAWISCAGYQRKDIDWEDSQTAWIDLRDHCPNVTAFRCPANFSATDAALIGQAFRSLKVFIPAPDITSECLQALSQHCHSLTTLVLQGAFPHLCVADLEDLISANPHLMHLHLGIEGYELSAVRGGEDIVRKLLPLCSQLRSLWLYAEGINNPCFQAIAENCPLLEVLQMDIPWHLGIKNSASMLLTILKRGRLTELSVLTSPETGADVFVQAAVLCPILQILRVPGSDLTDTALYALATHCKRLHTLDISECQVTAAGIAALIEGCPVLRHLNIEHCPLTVQETADICDMVNLVPGTKVMLCDSQRGGKCGVCAWN